MYSGAERFELSTRGFGVAVETRTPRAVWAFSLVSLRFDALLMLCENHARLDHELLRNELAHHVDTAIELLLSFGFFIRYRDTNPRT